MKNIQCLIFCCSMLVEGVKLPQDNLRPFGDLSDHLHPPQEANVDSENLSPIEPNRVPTNSQPTVVPTRIANLETFPSVMPSLVPSKENLDSNEEQEDEDERPMPVVNQGLGVGASIAIGCGGVLVIGATMYVRRRVQKNNQQDFAKLDYSGTAAEF